MEPKFKGFTVVPAVVYDLTVGAGGAGGTGSSAMAGTTGTDSTWNDNAEGSGENFIDLLSNGFKIRSDDGTVASGGDDMIYMAWAEAPFVNSNGVPCNAR